MVDLVGTIQNQPKVLGDKQRFTILSRGSSFLVTTQVDPSYWYGQSLQIKGALKISLSNGRELLALSYPLIRVSPQQSVLAVWSEGIREHVGKIYGQVLPDDWAGLLSGMLFGVQADFSPNFLLALRYTGVMHIIAASGMNITLTAGGLMGILLKFFHRRMAIVLCLVSIFAYTALAGFQPSIIRAAIMGSMTLAAGLIGRQSYSVIGLFVAAVGMLFINPGWLFDIGFQLSFLATAGLFFLKPLVDRLLSKWLKKDNIFLADSIPPLPPKSRPCQFW